MREIRGLAVTAKTVPLARSVVQPGVARPAIGDGGDGSRAIVNQKASRFRSLKCGDGDPALTIDLKPWTWSDGTKRACRGGLAGFAPLGSEDWYATR